MARVKRAVNAHKKRRVVLERASGYRGQRSRLYRKAKEQLLHSFTYNFRDRKARKGDFRKLWIQRINAAVRAEVQKWVDQANEGVSRAESVRKFVVLDAQFTQENKCLTPSLKVVRPAVNRVFADVIDRQLYAGKR